MVTYLWAILYLQSLEHGHLFMGDSIFTKSGTWSLIYGRFYIYNVLDMVAYLWTILFLQSLGHGHLFMDDSISTKSGTW